MSAAASKLARLLGSLEEQWDYIGEYRGPELQGFMEELPPPEVIANFHNSDDEENEITYRGQKISRLKVIEAYVKLCANPGLTSAQLIKFSTLILNTANVWRRVRRRWVQQYHWPQMLISHPQATQALRTVALQEMLMAWSSLDQLAEREADQQVQRLVELNRQYQIVPDLVLLQAEYIPVLANKYRQDYGLEGYAGRLLEAIAERVLRLNQQQPITPEQTQVLLEFWENLIARMSDDKLKEMVADVYYYLNPEAEAFLNQAKGYLREQLKARQLLAYLSRVR